MQNSTSATEKDRNLVLHYRMLCSKGKKKSGKNPTIPEAAFIFALVIYDDNFLTLCNDTSGIGHNGEKKNALQPHG